MQRHDWAAGCVEECGGSHVAADELLLRFVVLLLLVVRLVAAGRLALQARTIGGERGGGSGGLRVKRWFSVRTNSRGADYCLGSCGRVVVSRRCSVRAARRTSLGRRLGRSRSPCLSIRASIRDILGMPLECGSRRSNAGAVWERHLGCAARANDVAAAPRS